MKLRPFELALVIIFGVLMVLALILLRTYSPEPKEGAVLLGGAVTIWGTLPAGGMNTILSDLTQADGGYREVSYRYIPPVNFDQALLQARADGKAPDLLLISSETLAAQRSNLQPFSYESFPLRDFRSLYIDGAELLALSDGIYGYPVAIDPLVQFWNRDMFSARNLLKAPATWEEVVAVNVSELTVRDLSRTISESALAMGEYSNIRNAFGIISMLSLQGGSLMTKEGKGGYQISLDETQSGSGKPFTQALNFYTNFSNQANTLYSWNKTMPLDRDAFLREELATYFGFGSEARELEAKNPNLNFDISPIPQGAGATVGRTYGVLYFFTVPRAATNKIGAYTVMQKLAEQSSAKGIADAYGLAPVHRSTLAAGSNDLYGRVIYQVAPSARGWLNPNRAKVDSIFDEAVRKMNANRNEVVTTVFDATELLEGSY